MEALKPALPDFSLSVTAGRENILNNFLKTKKVSFGALDIEGVNCDSLPVSLRIKAERLAWGGVVLDTLTAGIAQTAAGWIISSARRTSRGTWTT